MFYRPTGASSSASTTPIRVLQLGPVLYYLQWVSIWWAVFNLLPIRPLDGGHVAEELAGFENACKLDRRRHRRRFPAFRASFIGLFGLLFFGLAHELPGAARRPANRCVRRGCAGRAVATPPAAAAWAAA